MYTCNILVLHENKKLNSCDYLFSFANTASSLSLSDDACTNSQIIIIIRLAACLNAQHTAGGGADEHTEMAPLYCICSAVIIVSRFRYIGK